MFGVHLAKIQNKKIYRDGGGVFFFNFFNFSGPNIVHAKIIVYLGVFEPKCCPENHRNFSVMVP